MSAGLPTSVLGDALTKALDGRRVRSAVFTTFCLEPGFFEAHILSLLFPDQSFSTVRKVQMLQLEDSLAQLEGIAVYYDRAALIADGEPAQLDVRRIEVRRDTGVFHPKLVLLLVDDPRDGWEESDGRPPQSLIVGVLSANLTRAGWWESVEAGHFEEIPDRQWGLGSVSFRDDLLHMIPWIEKHATPGEPHAALERIRSFLRKRTESGRPPHHSTARRYHTRLFYGQAPLADWLWDLNLRHKRVNLEITSPFHDTGTATQIKSLIEAVAPRSVRIYLPIDDTGMSSVDEGLYREVNALASVVWADLPSGLVKRGGAQPEKGAPRRNVHAKVYRFWNVDGLDVVLVGSVNCTSPGTSRAAAGNLEASFLASVGDEDGARGRWWLTPLHDKPTAFSTEPEADEDLAAQVPFQASLRHDWESHETGYFLHDPVAGALEVRTLAGEKLAMIAAPQVGTWVPLTKEESAAVEHVLLSTSFLVVHADGENWTTMVQEESRAFRPSLLTSLSAEEILRYWALLSPAQKAALLESKLADEGGLQGLPVPKTERLAPESSFFTRFAGLFHAFGALEASVETALDEGRDGHATARLYGKKYDSLPVLLDRVHEQEDGDPVMDYLTYLCASQLAASIQKAHPDFCRRQKKAAGHLTTRLDRLPELRRRLEEVPAGEAQEAVSEEFLSWYETMFLAETADPSLAGGASV